MMYIIPLFLLFICSCDEKDNSPPPPPVPKEYTYLALGDSYTIGQGVDTMERWPEQLVVKLAENDVIITELTTIAKTGWTTGALNYNINNPPAEQHDIVSLLIGVNNQFQGRPYAEFTAEFDQLLNQAIELSTDGDKVFVVSIPDYGVTPFGSGNSETIAEELDIYNAYSQNKCNELGVPYINITEISRTLGSGENALAYDNLHPSGFQYGLWVEEILPVLLEMVE